MINGISLENLTKQIINRANKARRTNRRSPLRDLELYKNAWKAGGLDAPAETNANNMSKPSKKGKV